MMPEGADRKIRSVSIFYNDDSIAGFDFFDRDKLPIWGVGYIQSSHLNVARVVLAKNEVIVGVVAKLKPGFQSVYTDFQFQIAK